MVITQIFRKKYIIILKKHQPLMNVVKKKVSEEGEE